MPIPPQCQEIWNELQALKVDRADLQAELHFAAPQAKGKIAARIIALNSQIAAKQEAYDTCTGKPKPPSPVTSVLTGTFTFTVAGSGSPATLPIAITLMFSGQNHAVVDMMMPSVVFPPVTLALPLASCPGTLTIAPSAPSVRGTYSTASGVGDLSIPLQLGATFAITGGGVGCMLARFAGLPRPSTLTLTPPGLTTGTVASGASPVGSVFGAGLDLVGRSGLLTLVGAGTFSGGGFAGLPAHVIISGTLSPIP